MRGDELSVLLSDHCCKNKLYSSVVRMDLYKSSLTCHNYYCHVIIAILFFYRTYIVNIISFDRFVWFHWFMNLFQNKLPLMVLPVLDLTKANYHGFHWWLETEWLPSCKECWLCHSPAPSAPPPMKTGWSRPGSWRKLVACFHSVAIWKHLGWYSGAEESTAWAVDVRLATYCT